MSEARGLHFVAEGFTPGQLEEFKMYMEEFLHKKYGENFTFTVGPYRPDIPVDYIIMRNAPVSADD